MPREDIQIVLAERHTVVGEVVRAAVAFVPSEDAIDFGHANYVIDTRKSADSSTESAAVLPIKCNSVNGFSTLKLEQGSRYSENF